MFVGADGDVDVEAKGSRIVPPPLHRGELKTDHCSKPHHHNVTCFIPNLASCHRFLKDLYFNFSSFQSYVIIDIVTACNQNLSTPIKVTFTKL